MGKKDKKESHSLISILPKLFKVLERILFEKMPSYFKRFYQINNSDFKKDIAHNILNLLVKWEKRTLLIKANILELY